jgi:cell division protein FtsB
MDPSRRRNMRRRIAILVVGVVVSLFGAGACAGEDEVRQRAQDEVDLRRQQAEDRVQEERTRLEQQGRTLIEEQ